MKDNLIMECVMETVSICAPMELFMLDILSIIRRKGLENMIVLKDILMKDNGN